MGSPAHAPPAAGGRLTSIDAVRGLVMVLMALDHVRDFFHAGNLIHSPTNLDSTTVAVFLTRWVTNFCAPSFVLLTGVGAYLWAEHGKSVREASQYLFTRGLWLVLLELTVIRCLGWYFNVNYHDVPGTVIWAIGWSMVALAGLVYLPRPLILGVGITLIATHNLWDNVEPSAFGRFDWLWAILHSGNTLEPLPGLAFRPVYPLLPWIGVMAAGYGIGPWMSPSAPHRPRFFLGVGVALTLAFVVLRGLNVYGDPVPWSVQRDGLFTAFSFVNCEKYPPSLLYLLMTLGPAFLLLAALEWWPAAAAEPLVTLGRVPLFFYLLHLPVIHGLAVLLSFLRYGQAVWLFEEPPWSPGCADIYPPGYGYGLLGVYVLCGLVLVLLWPACKWYAGLKRRHHTWWLTYL
jgi:uncharacterized membrane protein